MSVTIIPAAQNSITLRPKERYRKMNLRVAAYCRVSTDCEEQESSYEVQISHYTEMIEKEPTWELAGIYADEGISGTDTRKRDEFNRMILDCISGRIDLVITKSISRFARNTLDCLTYIRQLKSLGIPILFEKENINTLSASGELLITIMASIAQQESQSISQNVRMGIQYRFQQGRPMLNHSWFMGYTNNPGEDLQIVPEEAKIVRQIFRDFLEGLSYGEIAQHMESLGIKSPTGKDRWYASTITSMLTNEKYAGDLMLQKSYTKNFLTKERSLNNGRFPRYYVKNAHPPIVPRAIFFQARGELLRRQEARLETGKREIHRGRLGLNQRLCCGSCGAYYRRISPTGYESML